MQPVDDVDDAREGPHHRDDDRDVPLVPDVAGQRDHAILDCEPDVMVVGHVPVRQNPLDVTGDGVVWPGKHLQDVVTGDDADQIAGVNDWHALHTQVEHAPG